MAAGRHVGQFSKIDELGIATTRFGDVFEGHWAEVVSWPPGELNPSGGEKD